MNNFSASQSFRVIDIRTGEFTKINPFDKFFISEEGYMYDQSDIRKAIYFPVDKHLIASSVIGLTDSNGQEIYAGDVVETTDGEKHYIEWVPNKLQYMMRTFICDEHFTIWGCMNVIGNCWQPEYKEYLDQLQDSQ